MTEAESPNNLFIIDLPDQSAALSLTGPSEAIRRKLETLTGVSLVLRGLQLVVKGSPAQLERTVALIELLRPFWEEGQPISLIDIQTSLSALDNGLKSEHESVNKEVLVRSQSGRLFRPRTIRQKSYLDAINSNQLTIALGPAGTGKTFLAVILAVRMLSERKVERIILTRPIIETSNNLSHSPREKINPYLRPLHNSLHALLGVDKTNMMIDKGVIEIAPLSYMKGRTLTNAFIILDEAQNTTINQMRMILTRLGENSWMVVTGDLTQIDLSNEETSGLIEATEVLKGLDNVHIAHLTTVDVVRHAITKDIIRAYISYDQKKYAKKVH